MITSFYDGAFMEVTFERRSDGGGNSERLIVRVSTVPVGGQYIEVDGVEKEKFEFILIGAMEIEAFLKAVAQFRRLDNLSPLE